MSAAGSIARLALLCLALFVGYVWWNQPAEESKICYTIEGFAGCGFFERAKAMGNKLKASDEFRITIRESPQRSEYVGQRLPELNKVVKGAGSHRTSPFVYTGCGEDDKRYVGGASEFIERVKTLHKEFA
ncbi:hypothetical protein DFJ74DRAFT_677991 [Hyaloraphidium curvatum]|nr:hypothetical protein DFJ74DRAFT_677991 [Hyaloraphidium curvatum]